MKMTLTFDGGLFVVLPNVGDWRKVAVFFAKKPTITGTDSQGNKTAVDMLDTAYCVDFVSKERFLPELPVRKLSDLIPVDYDGFEKNVTDIGADVFVGSNTALIAPVKLGDGSTVAAGSTIARNIPPGALAINRAELEIREGWATRYREMRRAKKSSREK